jgi:hypothetical protein
LVKEAEREDSEEVRRNEKGRHVGLRRTSESTRKTSEGTKG